MTPNYSTANSDNESLQADVMRFMAIIAFCLIAILALVKEVEPPATSSKAAATPPTTPTAVRSAPIRQQLPAATPPVEQRPMPTAPTWQSPITKPATEVVEIAPTRKPTPEVPRLEVSAVTPAQTVSTSQPPAPQSTSSSPDEEGLSLRFASPGDFLRLIARGQIKVYAFNNLGDVLGLNPAYEFLSARTPGKVYELLPATIPSLIVDSLERSRQDGDSFSWGITLPQKIESKITGYLAAAESGQLVIDRYGEVHHVAHN